MEFSDERLVSVVIPVFGREDVFASVGMLRAQPYAGVLKFIIVDNGNSPALSKRLSLLASDDCHVIRFDVNRGGSAAYIAGMDFAINEHVDSRFVWLLDDDAMPNSGTLPGLITEMNRLIDVDPLVASVGSAVLSAKMPDRIVECGARFSPLLTKAFPKLRGRRLAEVPDQTVRVDYAAACSLLVRKSAVRTCGFWEDVFIHLDDIEWGLRVSRAGWHNYATTASTVVHPEFNPDKTGPWICYFDARNQYWLADRYGRVYVMAAWLKNGLKNLWERLFCGHRVNRVRCRRLAWSDYKAGIRRTRAEVLDCLVGIVS